MKNKLIYFFLIFFLILFKSNNSIAENEFTFESNSIEITDNGNNIIARNGVQVKSKDGLQIFSDETSYSKISKKLILIGKVIIFDTKKNIEIKSDKIEYDKSLEIIISNNETFINIDDKYNIKSENLTYLRSKNIIKSNKKTTLQDKLANKVETDNFVYFVDAKKFVSKNLDITDKDKNQYYSKESAIDLSKNEIAAKDIEVYFAKNGDLGNHARLKGNSMISSENLTIVNKGIFTTCKESDTCPPWSLQSEEIQHDKEKKVINYKNALLKFYDTPIFYFPKFFHPDPSVKRQSGFLIPSITSSSNSGNALNIPYFKVIAENKDLTISPRFFFNNDLLVQNEYRQVGKNYKNINDFSIKKLDHSTKSHFFSNTKIFLDTSFENSEVEINLEKTSNDTYLKSENISTALNNSQSLLNSYIKYSIDNENLNFFAEVEAFEDLSREKNSDKYQFIFPNFSLSKLLNTKDYFKGNLIYSLKGSNQKRETNINESYLINDLEYHSNIKISKSGLKNDFSLLFKNSSKKGENSETYSDNLKSENYFSSIFTTSLPMKKIHKKYQSYFSPKASLRLSPFSSPNIKNLDRKLNITNLFSQNRLGLSDSMEGGQSVTLGFDYNLLNDDNSALFYSSLGQIFRDEDDERLPLSTTMQNKRSDIIGKIGFNPSKNFEINYNFSADNNFDEVNYSFIESKFTVNNFITSFEFLEENNLVGSESYFRNDIQYKFNSNNSLKYNTRRNRKTDLTEYYNLIYEYRNDCLVAAIEYNKDYYEDRDIKPNEEIYFSLTLTPITSINSPNINK